MLFIKTALFTIIIPGTVTVLVPYVLVPMRPQPFTLDLGKYHFLGIIPIVIGILLYLSTALDFARIGRGTPAPIDPPRVLVVKGLYRYVRNPMYIGFLSVLFGEAVYFQSAILLFYFGSVFLAFHVFVKLYEEPTLERKFGESYTEYLKEVPRWYPRLKRHDD